MILSKNENKDSGSLSIYVKRKDRIDIKTVDAVTGNTYSSRSIFSPGKEAQGGNKIVGFVFDVDFILEAEYE